MSVAICRRGTWVVGLLLCWVVWLLSSFPVCANEYNYNQFAMGDRASGMGGVGVADAIAPDAPYYNPAGLGRARHDSISFMATLYGFRRYGVDSSFATGEDLKTDTFEIVPATAGSVMMLGSNTAAAFSMFITEQSTVSEIQSHQDGQHYFNFSATDKTLWIGPSLGHQLNERWLIGAGAYVTYRDNSEFDSMYWRDYHTAYSFSKKFYHYGLLGTLGVQYLPTEHWRFGVVAQTPSASLQGEGKIQVHQISTDPNNTYDEMVYADGLEANNRIPGKLGAGIAYTRSKNWSLALDVTYHFPASYRSVEGDPDGEIESVYMRKESVLDFSLGGEYYVRGIYPVRAGFFTSHSSASDIELDGESQSFADSQAPQINLYGVTFSVGRETARVNVNMGVNYIFGSGDAQGWDCEHPDDIHQTKVSASEQSLYFFFTTSYLL